MLAVFAQNGCNYNSAESWTVYLSRDPHSYTGYTPERNWQLPHFTTMKKVSDLKLFLPQSSYLLNSYRKGKFHSTYPIITAVQPRNYQLSPKEQKLLEQLAEEQTIEAQKKTTSEIIQLNKRRPFSLRQRAKRGPWYLNYMLMSGIDEQGKDSRFELWNLPLQLKDSTARLQYLGELEISLAPNHNQLQFNYLGQVSLVFRINNRLAHWQPYLDQLFSKPKNLTNHKSKKPVSFVANLLQVVAKPKRAYPYVHMKFDSQRGCRIF